MGTGFMNHRALLTAMLFVGQCAVYFFSAIALPMMAGCSKDKARSMPENTVVTADIQAGIEKHIEEETREGGGYFKLGIGKSEYDLKLVRVHTEYLSSLGPRRHFACVDLVDTSGDVYDVDFFMEGSPGSMIVTETTAHKKNGQPFYVWEQKEDKIWRRVAVHDAPKQLLGIKNGQDEFDFFYEVYLPKINGPAKMWLPLASSDAYQTVKVEAMSIEGPHRIVEDRHYGNHILYMELGPGDSGKKFEIDYHVRRLEKSGYESTQEDAKRYLRVERLVPLNKDFRDTARQVIKGKKSPLEQARALYDHVIDRMRYMKYGAGWGKGDAVYACNVRTGNCTDFHAYFIALTRSIGIPARFAIGAAIPSERYEGGIDGYHCWVEFYTDGKWWPVDISEADKYSSLATYYFGHHPANRFEISRGRDLDVVPAPASGPINFLVYPLLEVEGQPVKTVVQFSFNRI
ncbi:MAG: transglutaminase-like domain-containing protein [Elusimicrobia bacterium]|nr:transglutaminase-like domain-containing protein [Candidatus Obscuribacterium magneticum]